MISWNIRIQNLNGDREEKNMEINESTSFVKIIKTKKIYLTEYSLKKKKTIIQTYSWEEDEKKKIKENNDTKYI